MPTRYEIVWMKFLAPLPLLLVGDQAGYMILWDIKSKEEQYRCLMYARNMFTLKEAHTTTSCDYFYNREEKVLVILKKCIEITGFHWR